MDSHESLPQIKKTLDELRSGDLVPFEAAVSTGVDMVMMAHIAFEFDEKTDDGTPASFDTRLIRGLLRGELGFDGVVITDALEMEGARQHARTRYGGLTGGFERAVLAGSDLMLYSSSVPERVGVQDGSEPMIAVEVMQTIIETLSRVVDRRRIDAKLEDVAKHHEGVRNFLDILSDSQMRIAHLRKRASELRSPPTPKSEGNVIHLQDYASTPAIYKTVAERSVALLRDPESFIPVQGSDEWCLVPIEYHSGKTLKRQDLSAFVKGLCRMFPGWQVTGTVRGFETDATGKLQPQFAALAGALSAETEKRESARLPDDLAIVPVVSTRGIPPENFLSQLAEFVEQRQAPMVIVTGWPLVDWIPHTVGCLVTFGASAPVAAAVAAVLTADAEAMGSIPGLPRDP